MLPVFVCVYNLHVQTASVGLSSLYIPKIYMVSELYMNKDVEATFLEDVLRADGEKVN